MGQGWNTATRDEIGDQDSAGAHNPSLITAGQNWRREEQGLVVPKIVRVELDHSSYMGSPAGSARTDNNTKPPGGFVGNCQPSKGNSHLAQNLRHTLSGLSPLIQLCMW